MSDMHHRVGFYEPRWISYHAGQIDGEDHWANLKKVARRYYWPQKLTFIAYSFCLTLLLNVYLQFVEMPIISRPDCQEDYSGVNGVDDGMVGSMFIAQKILS